MREQIFVSEYLLFFLFSQYKWLLQIRSYRKSICFLGRHMFLGRFLFILDSLRAAISRNNLGDDSFDGFFILRHGILKLLQLFIQNIQCDINGTADKNLSFDTSALSHKSFSIFHIAQRSSGLPLLVINTGPFLIFRNLIYFFNIWHSFLGKNICRISPYNWSPPVLVLRLHRLHISSPRLSPLCLLSSESNNTDVFFACSFLQAKAVHIPILIILLLDP